ncbi:hypothetical protein [Methylobacillus sp.]|uniref:hypothetical protein n=1 Tax=Methylobacillus sp. TaxID=56818 RepID=UPI0012C32339|nr:hypothetical protein [Methylobacillus sp.]MPS47750.1 hypothetical protein [Methylobacillus sp.]
MLFKVDQKSLKSVGVSWVPRELDLESFLINSSDEGTRFLSSSILGEELLFISNQTRTAANKRADIFALDKAGNGVVVELKKDQGQLGVETQALQYLADFSKYQGKNFIRQFSPESKGSEEFEGLVRGFLGAGTNIEDINKNSRVILVARSFDLTLFSMGEWLSSKGVAFRCISYTPAKIGNEEYLSFSVAFDRSPVSIFPLMFSNTARQPGIFWHNIARSEQGWWELLTRRGQIPACFDSMPGDQGERIMKKYVDGDRIIAFAKSYGAIGWGVIKKPENVGNYRLVDEGSEDDFLQGDCLHRLNIEWKAYAKNLSDGVSAREIWKDFNIYHPVSTSVSIDEEKGAKLIQRLNEKFGRLN